MKQIWISSSEAVAEVMRSKTKIKALTARKILVGMAARANLSSYATTYSEKVTEIDEFTGTGPGMGNRNLGSVSNEAVPYDFWRYFHAVQYGALEDFLAGNFRVLLEVPADEVPPRFYGYYMFATPPPRVNLIQTAAGVHFCRDELMELLSDPDWQRWSRIFNHADRSRERGWKPKWAWDEAKAALTVHASAYPALIRNGVGPIVEELNQIFSIISGGDGPDQKEVYAYARLIVSQLGADDSAPVK